MDLISKEKWSELFNEWLDQDDSRTTRQNFERFGLNTEEEIAASYKEYTKGNNVFFENRLKPLMGEE